MRTIGNPKKMSLKSLCTLGVCLVALGACAVGPDYQKPEMDAPPSFKEADATWQPAANSDSAPDQAAIDDVLAHDSVFATLLTAARANNQTLKKAEAAYRQAQGTLDETTASLFPTLSLSGSDTRSGSGRRQAATAYKAGTDAAWEPDLWGRIRRSMESDEASLQASAADLAWARLSLEADLASAYVNLRALDELKALRAASVVAYRKSLKIAQDQYAAGLTTKADVATAQTQLSTEETNALQAGITRAQYEHQIAVLTGKAPSFLSIAPAPLPRSFPLVQADLPSTVLQRRPDIAAAERAVAAANAQIGVEIAAFFPNITLSASYGYAASAFSKLAQVSNSVWSVGPALAVTLFDGGARSARVEQARASYDQSVAAYRETVLEAFQDVEDNLIALRLLAEQEKTTKDALTSAREAEKMMQDQYKEGLVTYTEVASALASREAAAEKELSVRQSRLLALIALRRATGVGATTP